MTGMTDSVKRVKKLSYLTGAAIAAVLLLKKESGWALGLMAGIIWCVVNYSLTVNLFEVALLQRAPNKLTKMLMIKFPVLYVAGFFILKSGLFPVMSFLAGIGVTLLTIGIANIWPKRA